MVRHTPLLLDVSRLVGRLMKGRLPTGIDRVALAYVRHYAHRAQAFVRDGRRSTILPRKQSHRLFDLLLDPPGDFTSRFWKLVVMANVTSLGTSPPAGSLLLNIGHSGLEYHRYPDLLRRIHVRPVFMVHDLIPITHPEYCRAGEAQRHIVRMNTVLDLAQGVIANSQATLDELHRFARQRGCPVPTSAVAYLAPPAFPVDTGSPPLQRPYFVMVGTIEPRKNHLLIFQVWKRLVEQLGDDAPELVIIGQRGWECEQVLDMLERSPLMGAQVRELRHCTDDELVSWLRHARALLFPSFVEGFGLPLVEALALGTPVIASNLPVFHEIAGDIPDYLDPLDGLGWLALIREYAGGASKRCHQQLQRMAGYHPPTWDAHFATVDEVLERVGR